MESSTITIVIGPGTYDEADLLGMIREAVSKLPCIDVQSVSVKYNYSDVNPTGRAPFGWHI